MLIALAPGMRLGRYMVHGLIGRGGIGEVYRAHDPRLGRDVALRVIGVARGTDPEIHRRFDTEARLAASLDHPRICAIHDVAHEAGIEYLVMDLLEGETLASRLSRGPIPMPDLLGYAIEIASGLAYAHARQVVHRDIKPASIFLTRAGVKIVDFGLAALQLDGPPITARIGALDPQTRAAAPGSRLHHTPEYVPSARLPDQEDGRRADILAFGLVLYEMATGQPAFTATTRDEGVVSDVMAAEPPPMEHGSAPPAFEWLVRRCLKKNPDARWQSMADIEGMLKWMASSAHAHEPVSARPRRGKAAYAAAAVGGAALLGLVWFTGVRGRESGAAAPPIAITVPPPDGARFTLTASSTSSAQLALSPDGTMLAFVATAADDVSQIWIRRRDSPTPYRLPGTTNGTYPFWSPDSRSLAFFADRELRRIDLNGGPARPVADAPGPRGGTWSTGNVILFAPLPTGGILRVNADGSGLAEATTPAPGDVTQRWPQFLPDGRHFLFVVRHADRGAAGVYLGRLDSPERTLLVASDFGAVYAPPGQVLYVADGALMSRTLDVSQRRLTGDAVPLVTDIGWSSNFYGAFSASATGVLAYARNASAGQLVWMNRAGRTLGVAADRGRYVDFQLSPDGRSLAVARAETHSDRPDIHVLELQRGNDTRLTSTRETDASPIWAPDAMRLVFRSNRERVHDLFITMRDRPGAEQLLLSSEEGKYPTDWHRGRGFVVYHTDTDSKGWDIRAAPVDRPGTSYPLVSTRDDEVQGRLSPDNRWLAYTSFSSSEAPEVFATLLDGERRRLPISVGGGSDPHWSADGRELFYVGQDGMLMSVAVHMEGDLRPGEPRPLFRIGGTRFVGPYASRYDIDASGQRFLVLAPLGDPQTLPLNVVVNWARTLQPN